MSRNITFTELLTTYVDKFGTHEVPAQVHCREFTKSLSGAGMQIGADQGAFMALMAKLIGAKRYLEVGTFTGYSALSVALALPEDGRAVCLDISKDYTDHARRFWKEAGVDGRIDLRIGPALESLDVLIAEKAAPFDFAFIDADKTNYDGYYERALKLMRPGGLIALDNMLWGGDVAKPDETDTTTVAIRALNAKIHDDSRVDMTLLTLGDGVLLARKH